MPHMIEDEMIAYKGATPWHGLGTRVEDTMSGQDMLIAAKMGWRVQRRSLAMKDAQGDKCITDPLKAFRAIVRADTDRVFQVATDKYHPIQNEEIVDFFKEYCEAGHARLETVGALQGGCKVWALARLNGGSTADLGNGDELRGYMLLATSHDGSLRTIGKPTQVCVVCWNTLSAALGEKSTNEFRMKHTRKFTPQVAKEAQQIMGLAIQSIQATNEKAAQLAKVGIDDKGRVEFVKRLLSGETLLEQIAADAQPSDAALLERIVDNHASPKDVKDEMGRLGKAILAAMLNSPGSELPTRANTLWGAVNGVTYYSDHERGRGQDTRLANSWFGAGDHLKTAAMNTALEIAGL